MANSHPVYHPVRDLLADPETRAQIDDADMPLLQVLTQLCQEFSYHGHPVLEEPALLFDLRRDDDDFQYRLWFLYPPSFQRLSFHQVSRIYVLGTPFVDATGIFWEIEPPAAADLAVDAPRLALTVLVTMRKAPVVAETKETISVATSVVYHAASTLGANTPGGLTVRKQLTGMVLNNTASPRATGGGGGGATNNKRPRSDSTAAGIQGPGPKRAHVDPLAPF
jgi:hypothetical protein